ncbi:MAG: polysaccharide deacetylase [Lachnospiraceae bacterium]|nr:polysaccharide deacetylase [Lachnospiraceae bacterium]
MTEEEKEAAERDHTKRIRRIRQAIVLLLVFLCILPTMISVWALHRIGQMNGELENIERMLLQLPAAGNGGEGRMTEKQRSEEPALPEKSAVSTEEQDWSRAYLDDPSEEAIEEEIRTEVKHVYLTFDDGPSVYTDDILDILDRYGVKATFFVNGRSGYDTQYRRIVEDGHSIGMHSYSHVYERVYKDLDSFAEDLYQIQKLIYDLTGVDCHLYRFPGGSSNQVHDMDMKRCIQYLNAKDIHYFDWNVSSGDALPGTHSAEEITSTVLSQVSRSGDDTVVVLMHDSPTKKTTVEALPAILDALLSTDGVDILPITDDTKCIQHIK